LVFKTVAEVVRLQIDLYKSRNSHEFRYTYDMTLCPSEEQLSGMLDDALGTPEREALAEHVEQCNTCLQKLARMTEISESGTWQRVTHLRPCSDAEEAIVKRLKLARRSMASFPLDPAATPTMTSAHGKPSSSATIDFVIPSVPGYEIIEILGRGGMGIVFKARHLALQRIVALKMFQNWAHAGEKELSRFRAEADVIARLQHPNIVQIYDVGDVA
jgi:anti-sigma factor RsiW